MQLRQTFHAFGSQHMCAPHVGRSRRPFVHAQAGSRPLYTVKELNNFTLRVGGDDELPITATVSVHVPTDAPGRAPLVLLSAGFLLKSSLYTSYATDLASQGYAVALYDISELTDDVETVTAMQLIVDACQGGNAAVSRYIEPRGVALLGHSRGAKLSCLAAASPKLAGRVRGLILLDPVDNTPMTPPGEGYPTSLPGLARTNAAVLVIGAGSGGDVVPESANYRRFMAASRGPTWCLELHGAGHLAFLDTQIGLFSLFSAPGPTPDAAVREAAKLATLVWLQHAVFPGADVDSAACPRAVVAAEAQIRQVVKGAMDSTALRLDQLQRGTAEGGPTAAPPGAASSSTTSSRTSTSGSRSSAEEAGSPPLTVSYEELARMRARELKALLKERGIRCDDCFEKQELLNRVVETCGVGARR